jgi:GntR family transcriptional regulator
MLNKKSPLPLYIRLAELLRRQIRDKIYLPGDRVPSENALADEHAIGRPTARQALETLVREGVLTRVKGSGTYVAPSTQKVDLFSLAGTMASFSGAGLRLQTEILENSCLQDIPSDGANPFGGKKALAVKRIGRVEQEPVLLENIFFHPQLFASILDFNLHGRSLSSVVREHLHLSPLSAEQRFSIEYPAKNVSRLLGIAVTQPVLLVRRFLHFPDAKNAVYSDIFCRTDRFVFTQTIGAQAP